jgi:hypothetical protein
MYIYQGKKLKPKANKNDRAVKESPNQDVAKQSERFWGKLANGAKPKLPKKGSSPSPLRNRRLSIENLVVAIVAPEGRRGPEAGCPRFPHRRHDCSDQLKCVAANAFTALCTCDKIPCTSHVLNLEGVGVGGAPEMAIRSGLGLF